MQSTCGMRPCSHALFAAGGAILHRRAAAFADIDSKRLRTADAERLPTHGVDG